MSGADYWRAVRGVVLALEEIRADPLARPEARRVASALLRRCGVGGGGPLAPAALCRLGTGRPPRRRK